MHEDFDSNYGGYSKGWQWLGIAWPVIGLLCFVVCLFLCTTEEPFEHDVKTVFSEDKIAKSGQAEKTSARDEKPGETVAIGTPVVDGPKDSKESENNQVVPEERPAEDN